MTRRLGLGLCGAGLDQLSQIHPRGGQGQLGRADARDFEQVVDEPCEAVRLVQHHLEPMRGELLAAEHELCLTLEVGERVAQLVADHREELLLLLLGRPPLADVARNRGGAHNRARAVLDRGDAQGDRDAPPILGHPFGLVVLNPLPPPQPLHDRGEFIRTVGGDQPRDGLADRLRHRVAVEPLRRGVPARNHRVQGLADDRVFRGLHDGGEPRRLRRGAAPLGHIAKD